MCLPLFGNIPWQDHLPVKGEKDSTCFCSFAAESAEDCRGFVTALASRWKDSPIAQKQQYKVNVRIDICFSETILIL
jgi:hypothetical protein